MGEREKDSDLDSTAGSSEKSEGFRRSKRGRAYQREEESVARSRWICSSSASTREGRRSRRTASIAEAEANPRCRGSVAAGRGRRRGGNREQAAACADGDGEVGLGRRRQEQVEEEEFARVVDGLSEQRSRNCRQ